MRLPRLNYPLPPRQRGVFGLMAVGLMLLMVISVALAIDTGRLYLEQRHMQRVADLAALEAAGAVTLVSQAPDTELASAAKEAARRNGHDSEDSKRALGAVGGGVCHAPEGDGSVRVFFAHSPDAASVDCNTLEGSYTGTLERHAVEVTASHQVRPSLFGSLLGEDEITISATAAAYRPQAEPYAVFSVGSRLLNVDTDESALAPVLRGLLDLGADASVAGFGGIADASVSLADLVSVDELTAGSTEELLGAELKLLDLITRLKAAHHDSGSEEDAPELLALQALNDRLTAFISTENIITVGDLLDIGTERAPLDVEVSALDLLSAALLIANQENAIALPGLNLSVPGVTDIEAMLAVIEPPQIAIGPVGCVDHARPPCEGNWKTEARTAQLVLGVGANVEIPLLAKLGLKLGVTAAGARAGVESARPATEDANHEWEIDISASQTPLTTELELQLSLLESHIPWLDEENKNYSKIGEVTSFLQSTLGLATSLVTNLINGLINIVSGLVSALLSLLYHSYITSDGTQVCGRVLLILPVGCDPTPTLEEELETGGGETTGWHDDLDDWLASSDAQQHGTPDSYHSHTLNWPTETVVTFDGDGSLEGTATALGNLAGAIDIRAELFGVDLGVSNLLSPLLGIVDAVVGNVVGSLAAGVIDPLLDELGVNISEAEVRVIHIDHHTAPPELL
ncbi:pilus assembly protein TadG-related protein [Halomonas mongoliensis]|uniref:pilus assembly protein TadG-related protein n=1 Tax=Halomonas mongoliensis TaxID=321265 RepID=UPI00403AE0F5